LKEAGNRWGEVKETGVVCMFMCQTETCKRWSVDSGKVEGEFQMPSLVKDWINIVTIDNCNYLIDWILASLKSLILAYLSHCNPVLDPLARVQAWNVCKSRKVSNIRVTMKCVYGAIDPLPNKNRIFVDMNIKWYLVETNKYLPLIDCNFALHR
jgi:hypothetical protein